MAAARRPNPDDYSEQMLVCIQNCQDCHRACLQTFAYCLKRGGRHADAELLRTLLDCADMSLTCAGFMIRASDLHVHTCEACSAVCHQCAEACATLAEDSRMQALADTCQHCADSCSATAGPQAAGAVRGATMAAPVAGVETLSTTTASALRGPRRPGAVFSRRKTES